MDGPGYSTHGWQPPGWYDDPWTPGVRWWDGGNWTAHVAPRPGTGPPGNAPGARSGTILPWVIAGAAALLIGAVTAGAFLVIRGIEDRGSDSSAGDVARQPSAPAPAPAYEPPASNRLPEVALGRSVVMRGQSPGERIRIAALGVVDPVPAGDSSFRPRRGRRWVGVRVKVESLGPGLFDDAIDNGARLLSGGRRYRPVTKSPGGCPPFEAVIELQPGRSATGCVIYEIPRGRGYQRLRYTPSSENSPDVATWRLDP